MSSAIAIAAWVAPAQAASLTAWNFDPTTNHLEVTVKNGTTPRYFLMAQPARIVMDLPGTSIAGVKTQETYGGAVRQIRVSQFQPGMTRIVLELSPGVKLASGQVNLQKMGDATRWTLQPLLADSAAQAARSSQPAPPRPVPPAAIALTPTTAPQSSTPQSSTPQSSTIAVPPPLSESAIAATAASSTSIVPPVSQPSSPPQPMAVPSISPQLAKPLTPRAVPAQPSTIVPLGSQATVIVPPLSTQSLDPSEAATSTQPTSSTPAVVVPPTLPPGSSLQNPVTVPPIDAQLPNSPAKPAAIPTTRPIAAATTKFPPTTAIVLPVPSNPVVESPTKVVTARSTPEAPLFPIEQPEARSTPEAPLFPIPSAPASVEIPTTLATIAAKPAIAVPSLQALSPSPSARSGSSVDLEPTTAQGLRSPAPKLAAQLTVPPLQSPAAIDLPYSPSVSVPPLQPQQPAAIAPAVPAPPQSGVIDFGQPLSGSAPPSSARSNNGNLSAGTLLSLRYPGTASLKLRTGTPHQEVLLLQSEIRDAVGNLVAPKDSMVIGRFETSKAGSRFIAQAISLQGRSVPLMAQSEILAGSMQISDRNLAVNSGIGAIAGGIIGGFSSAGLVGGAATGAAVTLLTSPKPATVQPGQIVQVRLLQDFQ